MERKFKVRFNLGRGQGYMKWKVIDDEGNYQLFNPEEGSIYMKNCKLVNKKSGAKKIFKGANKFVVAWIECEDFKFIKEDKIINLLDSVQVKYNPRLNPYWTICGQDYDNGEFSILHTVGREVFFNINERFNGEE